MAPASLTIDNARIVLRDRVIEGWLAVENGAIVEVGRHNAPAGAIDFRGDFLLPGLVELHTDHLESHLRPRPRVHWPTRHSITAYDAQLAASGITTVFDSVRVGRYTDDASNTGEARRLLDEIARLRDLDLLRITHLTHLRCEICADDVIDAVRQVMEGHQIQLISLMDHTPGARQFTDLEAWRTYFGGKSGYSAPQLDELMTQKLELHSRNYSRHRSQLVTLAKANHISIASHDDSTPAQVRESIESGVQIAEFPTNIESARLSHEASIAVLMGAPNVVRGGSHSGNVAAEDLARANVLDVLSSDYVPAAMLAGAFELERRIEGYDLAQAVRTVTINPARAVGLEDRGEIAPGQIADMLRVRLFEDVPIIREVYRHGRRII